jgi:hypothetical protein
MNMLRFIVLSNKGLFISRGEYLGRMAIKVESDLRDSVGNYVEGRTCWSRRAWKGCRQFNLYSVNRAGQYLNES